MVLQTIYHDQILLTNHVNIQYGHGFLDLGTQGLLVVEHVQQLAVVNFQQHSCDLAGKRGVESVDQWVETFSC